MAGRQSLGVYELWSAVADSLTNRAARRVAPTMRLASACDAAPLDFRSQLFDGRESVAASRAFQIVSEAPDGTEVAGSQAGARLFNLFLFGSEILRNQRLHLLGDRNGPRRRRDLRLLGAVQSGGWS